MCFGITTFKVFTAPGQNSARSWKRRTSMITQMNADSRLPRRAASTAFAALLLLGLPLAAQSRGHGGGGGGGHTAHSTGGGSHSSSSGGAPHYSPGPSSSGGSSSGGSGGRTAHESSGGSSAHRQPHDRGGRGDHDGRGGHGGHGGFGHGGGFYYPYGWGWGFWPGFSWGWYDDPYGYGYGYPYGGYGGYGGYGHRYYDRSDTGALDLDVSPGRTHVFVDGEDLGIVDRYDGWPSYLWLPRGTYDVAFYLDGYKTIARQITIYPGTVIDIDDRMEPGDAVRPQDLATKTHERRDQRMTYERERQGRIDRQHGDDDEDWQDRVHRDRGRRDDDHDRGGPAADGSRSHLRLSVQPEDASVYLDGQFVGTGTDLSLLRGGIMVSPGNHKLAVVRPGRRAVEKDFTVKDGEDVRLEIALESGSR